MADTLSSKVKKSAFIEIIFMSYSLIMSIIWFIMESPDLAITEAAVGAGVTSVLLFLTLKKVNVLKGKKDE